MLLGAIDKFFFKLWFSAGSSSHKRIIECFEKNPDAKILDLGCDNGGLIFEKAQEGIGSKKIWGIDIDKKKLDIAKRYGITAICSDLNKKIPLKDNLFDVIHASQIIEHLNNVDGF